MHFSLINHKLKLGEGEIEGRGEAGVGGVWSGSNEEAGGGDG